MKYQYSEKNTWSKDSKEFLRFMAIWSAGTLVVMGGMAFGSSGFEGLFGVVLGMAIVWVILVVITWMENR